ncbi:MAG: response regulator, partial [Myxococcales bacterium]|nr:response regulator [Myxococcales bacterium]
RTRRRDAPSPPPVFDAATLDGHPLAADGSTEVPPGPGELRVAFTVAALRRPELLRFEYRLAGGAWTPAGDRRAVRIHNLEPGRHHFEVRTVDGAGHPSDSVAGLSFRLRPAWHQVPAMRLLLALALVAIGVALGAVRMASLKRRARAMADEIEQRKRAEVALVAEQEQRLALQAQLDHARRLEAIGRLAGGVAHDFNNLLTVTTSYTQLLQMDLEPEPGSDTAEFLDGIVDCTQKAADLTAQLLSFGRRQHLEQRAVDLGAVVDGLMPMLRSVVREDVTLELDRPEGPLSVFVDRGQVEQAVVNLVANAAASMPTGGTVSLGLGLTFPADAALLWPDLGLDGTLVRLSVRDTGEGIAPDVLPHVFEPFFAPRRAGVGTGLGLAAVHGFVEQSGGQVRVHSTPGEGTRFDVFLPCREDLSQHGVVPTPPPTMVDATQVRGRVLLCDDAEGVRRSVAEVLESRGFEVVVAGGGDEALALLEGPAAKVEALVTDVVMPGMDGPALARSVRQRRPGLPVLFITGYADHHDLAVHAADGPTAVVLKPFDGPRLVGALRSLLVKAERRRGAEAHGPDDQRR